MPGALAAGNARCFLAEKVQTVPHGALPGRRARACLCAGKGAHTRLKPAETLWGWMDGSRWRAGSCFSSWPRLRLLGKAAPGAARASCCCVRPGDGAHRGVVVVECRAAAAALTLAAHACGALRAGACAYDNVICMYVSTYCTIKATSLGRTRGWRMYCAGTRYLN